MPADCEQVLALSLWSLFCSEYKYIVEEDDHDITGVLTYRVDKGIVISTLATRVFTIDLANVQNVLYNFWKERVLLRSFQYYF